MKSRRVGNGSNSAAARRVMGTAQHKARDAANAAVHARCVKATSLHWLDWGKAVVLYLTPEEMRALRWPETPWGTKATEFTMIDGAKLVPVPGIAMTTLSFSGWLYDRAGGVQHCVTCWKPLAPAECKPHAWTCDACDAAQKAEAKLAVERWRALQVPR